MTSWRNRLHTHRRLVLFLFFCTLCFNLGFAGLVRYYPGTGVGGLTDARSYYWMADFSYTDVPPPFRYRPLLPSLAGLLAQIIPPLPIASWDTLTFTIFLVNSSLVALTALLIAELSQCLEQPPTVAPLAALLYLTAFTTVNGMLVGLVDAGESCILVATTWALVTRRWWLLPLLVALGALTKETTLVFALLLIGVWWLYSRRTAPAAEQHALLRQAAVALMLGGLLLVGVRAVIGGPAYAAHQLSLERLLALPGAAQRLFTSRPLLYTFAALLPLSLPSLARLPRVYLVATAVLALATVVLGLYADIGTNIYRPLFNTAGPPLIIASAATLYSVVNAASTTTSPV